MKSKLLLALLLSGSAVIGQKLPLTQPSKTTVKGQTPADQTSSRSTMFPDTGKLKPIKGDGKVISTPASVSSQWTTAGGAIYYSGAGLTNVGIGTANPLQKLDVNGSINISGGGSLMQDTMRILSTKNITNVFLGIKSGTANTFGTNNTFLGYKTGATNTTSNGNTFVGASSGAVNTTGGYNVSLGYASGQRVSSGKNNAFVGSSAGNEVSSGTENTLIGYGASNQLTTGNNNVNLGSRAGNNNITGSGNVFLGYQSGFKELGSDKLYIANSDTETPLIHGDFAEQKLVFNGKVGVGTSKFPTTIGDADISGFQLFVKGGILAEEVRISVGWADYVFDSNYRLKTLPEVEAFIKEKGHLPNVPSAQTVKEQGIGLGNIASIQQEKIEELTLYAIDQDKKIKAQSAKLDAQAQALDTQKNEIEALKTLVNGLINKK